MPQGFVKAYDDATGVGIIVRDDDRTEVVLRPGSLDGSMFRFLRQGQRVRFDLIGEGDDARATNLRFGSDGYSAGPRPAGGTKYVVRTTSAEVSRTASAL